MSLKKCQEIACNCGCLNVYHLSPSTPPAKCWVNMRELIQVMVHHQQENTVKRKGDGEVMVPVQAAISLLTKVEMEDFSIAPTINALKQACKSAPCASASLPGPINATLPLDAAPSSGSGNGGGEAGDAFHQAISNTIKILPMLSLPPPPPPSLSLP
jgi:hypothetical protein